METGESGMDTDSRVQKLKWALDITRESIVEADADKRSPLIGQYRALLAEIAAIDGEGQPSKNVGVNGLVILQEELAKRRQSGASATRSTTRRRV